MSVQAQTLNLLLDFKEQYNLTYLFISHNLGVIHYICTRIAVMYHGKILEIGPDRVAAFFAEPIAGAGGVLVPPEGYHTRIADVCKKYEVFLVSDEVVTAFGRLGEMFSSETIFGFTPDIITCAKGLTSGYIPLSANLISEQIYDVISVPQAKGASFTENIEFPTLLPGIREARLVE